MKRKYPNQPILGVSAIIIEKAKILLVKRGVQPALNKWTIPGGVVELGEKVLDALIREIKEECSIEIELIDEKPLDVSDIIIKNNVGKYKHHYVVIEFLAKRKKGSLTAKEDVNEAKWVSLNEVKRYDLTKSFRKFFIKHQQTIEKISSNP